MSSASNGLDDLIWATRGRSWGFRFLLTGGLADPLQTYERAFAGAGDGPRSWQNITGTVALRFPDPAERRDSAGRVIPHDFVMRGNLAAEVESSEAGERIIWPLVSEIYSAIWDADRPPSSFDLHPS